MHNVSTDGTAVDRMGLFVFPWGKKAPTVNDLVDLARSADEMGFHSIHLPYFFALDTDYWPWGNASMIDALAVLPFIGARTSRIKLCLSHWNFSMLHPYLWAQYLSTLQVTSGDRVMTTLTLGKRKEDFQVGLSSREEADARLGQGLELLNVLLSGESVPEGEFDLWDAAGLRLDPKPSSPITMWLNGSDASTIDRAARHAQYVKPTGMSPNYIRTEYRPAVDDAADRHGRKIGLAMSTIVYVVDPAESPTYLAETVAPLLKHERPEGKAGEAYVYGSPADCAEQITELYQSGVDYIALDLRFHGWETHEFATEQLTRIHERVIPLINPGDLPPLTQVSA
jgi:alkanesulfonate monooxygenase SsuD/methylene tetrahydromethanopterin reductase-like flavin-dependent oxidoreductase (luciferase family)